MLQDFNGHAGETTGARFTRLMGQHNMPFTVLGTSSKSAKMGGQSEATLAELTAQHGALPATPVQTTSRGRHYVFQVTQAVPNSAGTVGAHPDAQGKSTPSGIDTRGDGGYIIMPPSPGYAVTCDAEPAPLPDWLLALILKPATVPRAAVRQRWLRV